MFFVVEGFNLSKGATNERIKVMRGKITVKALFLERSVFLYVIL